MTDRQMRCKREIKIEPLIEPKKICGGICYFQGDIGEVDEYKCETCGEVYMLAQYD